MNEDTDRQVQPGKRSLSVYVYGDTAQEIEFAALDVARPFFGDGAVLAVVPDYQAVLVRLTGQEARAAGRKYGASVLVRVV